MMEIRGILISGCELYFDESSPALVRWKRCLCHNLRLPAPALRLRNANTAWQRCAGNDSPLADEHNFPDMIAALRRTVFDLLSPRLTWTLLKAVTLSALAYGAVWSVAWWLIVHSHWANSAWLNHSLHVLGGLGVMVLSLILFPSVFGVVQALFLDGVADRIESQHYPELGPARGAAVWDGMVVALNVLALMVVVNLVMLPVYIVGSLFFGAGMVLFYAVNGWLCGREYFVQVALRRMPRAETKGWLRANRGTLWLAGIAITLLGTVPLLNLAAPVVGCVFMVHVARTMRPPTS
jgi:uncharacterized protein involved in cysteine biosynthesis